jgi:hypothetical protein
MPITLNGDTGIVTPMYNGSITANAVTPSVNMKNRIINGAMVIDQRNAGASVTPTSGQFTVDRWQAIAAQTSKYSVQQSSTAPTGFNNSVLVTSLSAYSVLSTDSFALRQLVEGYNFADCNWGTANAKTVTLSFWVRSSLTGTFGGSFANSDLTRSYPFTYTISVADTWEQKSVTVAGDTTGTWVGATNGRGVIVWFGLGAGSTLSGTAGVWAGADYRSATGATSVVGTNGATFYITGVQLEVGSTATSFDYRPYGTELALCQRYAYKISGSNAFSPLTGAGQGTTATTIAFTVPAKVSMRATPSLLTTGNLCVTANGLNSLTAVTSMDVYRMIPENPMVQATVASGITAGVCYFLHGNNDTTASLLISAEL